MIRTSVREHVLDMWAQGCATAEISKKTGARLKRIERILVRARDKGDARAARRRAPNNIPDGQMPGGRTQRRIVADMHQAGMSVESISLTLGLNTIWVCKDLAPSGLTPRWKYRGLSVAGRSGSLPGTVPSGSGSPSLS